PWPLDAREACFRAEASQPWSSSYRLMPLVRPYVVGSRAQLRGAGRTARVPPAPRLRICDLDQLDVGRRRALRALLGVIAHLRALGERLEAAALDRAVVNEKVLTGVIRGDEPVALVVAEPLNGSCCHAFPSWESCACETREVQEQQLRN